MIYILAEEFIKQPSPLTATEQYLWNALFIGIIIYLNYQNVPDVIKFSEVWVFAVWVFILSFF